MFSSLLLAVRGQATITNPKFADLLVTHKHSFLSSSNGLNRTAKYTVYFKYIASSTIILIIVKDWLEDSWHTVAASALHEGYPFATPLN